MTDELERRLNAQEMQRAYSRGVTFGASYNAFKKSALARSIAASMRNATSFVFPRTAKH